MTEVRGQRSEDRGQRILKLEVGMRNAERGGDRRQMTKRMLTTDRHGGTRNTTEDFFKLLAISSVKLREFPW